MVRISLTELGKRFNRRWIFKGINFSFEAGNAYAITGPNGSGKSTLLQVLAGSMLHSHGTVEYRLNDRPLPPELHYTQVAMAAPYLELIEELTLVEFLTFHEKFKPFVAGYSITRIIEFIGLQQAANRQLRVFSSGMKQRVKLAQAFFSRSPVLLLDEPTANLDAEGITLYFSLVEQFSADRIVIIGSNDAQETRFCQQQLHLPLYQ
jgi:ABC-type multidrug transport system ATPase subunit